LAFQFTFVFGVVSLHHGLAPQDLWTAHVATNACFPTVPSYDAKAHVAIRQPLFFEVALPRDKIGPGIRIVGDDAKARFVHTVPETLAVRNRLPFPTNATHTDQAFVAQEGKNVMQEIVAQIFKNRRTWVGIGSAQQILGLLRDLVSWAECRKHVVRYQVRADTV
jgi:hypothetical protein